MDEEKGKKRLRFTFEDDVILLREIIALNPFANPEAWEEVQKNVSLLTKKQFLVKTIRQHIKMLLELWILKEKNNEKSSGVEEPYSEKDVLLQEIKELVEVQRKEKSTKQRHKLAENKKTEVGKTVRNEAAISFLERNACMVMEHDYNGHIIIEDGIAEVPSEDPEILDMNISVVDEKENETSIMNAPTPEMSQNHSKTAAGIASNKNASTSKNILGPIRTRAKRTTYMRRSGLEYLREKHQKELEIEEKRLALEERKIAVSERTIALAEKKFVFDSEYYKNSFDSQQKLIQNLIDIVKDLKKNPTKS